MAHAFEVDCTNLHVNEPAVSTPEVSTQASYTCMYILVFPWGPLEDLCIHTLHLIVYRNVEL